MPWVDEMDPPYLLESVEQAIAVKLSHHSEEHAVGLSLEPAFTIVDH